MRDIKVARFSFLKFVQTNSHGRETADVVTFYSLLITIAITSNNSSLFLS